MAEAKEEKVGKLTTRYGEPPALVKRDRGQMRNLLHRGPLLGEGGFARVYSAVEAVDGTAKALKVISKLQLKTAKNKGKLFAEIKLHQAMAHENIVRFEECFEDYENVYMVMEICHGGVCPLHFAVSFRADRSLQSMLDVLKRRKRYTEPETRFYLVQLISACHYMHSRSVIHRDLKLGNLFLDRNMNLKVGDFGLAALVRFPGERKKTICGTPNYIAPEILFGKDNGHSFEVDVWSIGVILYTSLIGKPPFQTKDVKEIYKKIKENAYDFPEGVAISHEATDLIQAILNTDPAERPPLTDILQYPFFSSQFPFPRAIPPSARHNRPDFSSITPAQSALNFRKACASLADSLAAEAAGEPAAPMPTLPQTQEIPTASVKQVAKAQESEVRSALAPDSPISELLSSARKPLCVSPAPSNRIDKERSTKAKSDRELAVRMAMGNLAANASPRQSIQPQQTNMNAYGTSSKASSKMDTDRAQRKSPVKPATRTSSMQHIAGSSTVNPAIAFSTSSRELYEACWMSLEAALSIRSFEALDNLSGALRSFRQGKADLLPVPTNAERPRVFITSWIDYTHKYGTAYQLADGSAGVYFNDSSTMILAPNKTRLDYISNKKNARGQLLRSNYSFTDNFDDKRDLKSKLYLLKHFQEYMSKTLEKQTGFTFVDDKKTTDMDFLVKYYRMKSAIVFKLSNDVMQVCFPRVSSWFGLTRDMQFNFFDHCKVLLSENAQVATFIGQDYRIQTYTLATVIKEGLKLGLLKTSATGKTIISLPPDAGNAGPGSRLARKMETCHFLLTKLEYCCEVLRCACSGIQSAY
jgi:serine/threonine protein kinase